MALQPPKYGVLSSPFTQRSETGLYTAKHGHSECLRESNGVTNMSLERVPTGVGNRQENVAMITRRSPMAHIVVGAPMQSDQISTGRTHCKTLEGAKFQS